MNRPLSGEYREAYQKYFDLVVEGDYLDLLRRKLPVDFANKEAWDRTHPCVPELRDLLFQSKQASYPTLARWKRAVPGVTPSGILFPAVHVPAGIYPLPFTQHEDFGDAA